MTVATRAMPVPFVKVCCMASIDEARRAVAAGAGAVGLVSEMPSGPGPIPDELIARIAAAVPPPTRTFLLTCRRDAASIAAQHRLCRTTTIQLVDAVAAGELRALRAELPDVEIVQVIHVTGEEATVQAANVAPLVDAILLDSGNPALPVKELGGTGRTHDWTVSRRIRESVSVPVILAGGLRAENVAEAIAAVRPAGVDLCSGVRTDGALDDAKLAGFFAAVRGAGAADGRAAGRP